MTPPHRLIVEAGWVATPDGVERDRAIVIEDGVIAAIEPLSAVANVDAADRLGGPDQFALPGLVNAHQHGRPDSTVTMGICDAPLECWLVGLLGGAFPDPYPATLRLCRALAASGVTTAVHMDSSFPATVEDYDQELRAVLTAYRDCGIRVVVAAGLRDRGVPVYGETDDFFADLPASLREAATKLVPRLLDTEALFEVIDGLRDEAGRGAFGDAAIAYGPAGPPWCSDGLLSEIAQRSAESGAVVHTHLLETWQERSHGLRVADDGTVASVRRCGLLTERLFAAHGVWLDAADAEALAAAGTSVVTNPASNLRLHAGIAPVTQLLDLGVNVALGSDNMAISGPEDLLDQLRLLRALQRRPGIEEHGLAAGVLLELASRNGGAAIGRPDVGVLRAGARGDVVLVDLPSIGGLAAGIDPLDFVLATASPCHLRTVVGGGRLLVSEGAPTLGEPDATAAAPGDSDAARVIAELMPHVRSHYARTGEGDVPPARHLF